TSRISARRAPSRPARRLRTAQTMNAETRWQTAVRGSGCGAWRRTPGGTIRDLLEVRACYKPRREILRIFDDCCHHEPRITVRFGRAVDVLRESGIRAVGNAVLSQIAGAQVARHDTQRSAPRGATTATSAAGQLP